MEYKRLHWQAIKVMHDAQNDSDVDSVDSIPADDFNIQSDSIRIPTFQAKENAIKVPSHPQSKATHRINFKSRTKLLGMIQHI